MAKRVCRGADRIHRCSDRRRERVHCALQKSSSIERGFDLSNVETALSISDWRAYSQETAARFTRGWSSASRAPGVEQATAAALLPTADATRLGPLTHPGAAASPGGSLLDAASNTVEPGYFATLGIPLLAGRDFDYGDIQGAPVVAIVSEEAARRFWPEESPIGKVLLHHQGRVLGGAHQAPTVLRIIGVVGNTRGRLQPPRPQLYLTLHQRSAPALHLLARSSHGRRLSREIQALLSSMDPSVPILTMQTLEEAAVLSMLPQRLAAGVSIALGSAGLLLAALGIYGVAAFVVVARTRDIGVRIALGAARTDVVWMVLRQGMVLVATGVSIGLVLAGASVQLLTRVLVGIPPLDPIAFAFAAMLFLGVGLIACYVPARHASRLEPLAALKCE